MYVTLVEGGNGRGSNWDERPAPSFENRVRERTVTISRCETVERVSAWTNPQTDGDTLLMADTWFPDEDVPLGTVHPSPTVLYDGKRWLLVTWVENGGRTLYVRAITDAVVAEKLSDALAEAIR